MEPGRTNQILKNVTFTARSGQLMAIMGGSGSGKTSLLDVVACRTTTGDITGHVLLNSVSRTKAIIDSCAGYVRQDDRLIAHLTVRETLMFVAQLKLPKSFSSQRVCDRVDEVIAELGLKHVANTKVGDANIRGLSGGERRRVSIGIHLLILPSVILLDEPTSGLDSFTATNIIRTLSLLAKKGRTILMSIHQPRFDIFSMIDSLMILSSGSVVYDGPANQMVDYFTSLGFPCPEHTNPCDFYIDLATVDPTSREREQKSREIIHSLHDAFSASAHASAEVVSFVDSDEVQKSMDLVRSRSPLAFEDNDKACTKDLRDLLRAYEMQRDTPGYFKQFFVILVRFLRVSSDDYPSILSKVIHALLMSVLLGTIYVDLKLDEQSVRDWFGIMFMSTVMYPYMVILGLTKQCHEERRFLYFELQDKLYSPVAYYFARILGEIPFHLVYIFFYCIPLYTIAGLKMDMYSMTMFFVVISASVFTSRCLAIMAAALMPTFQIAGVFAQIIFSLLLMSAGFFLNLDSIIPELSWMSDINYIRWSFQALSIVEIKDLRFDCNASLVPAVCPSTGEQALAQYGLDDGNLGVAAAGLGGSVVVFLAITLIGIKFIPQKPQDD
ncbi:ATP-binding cassette sub-family g member 8-like [Plakobranchus ocellatus]|uniref:ATP-binding cassette sub-family g member 8-like n=1 Tax=Plakobranchus ocellatus TaxID=259542 RepID=A0AAV4A9B2_9GAST|nr:ATP-binding cassette sub-family g member 8-like [Plakobranchus ocellatus]